MKERFINSSLTFIMKYQECDDLKIKKLKYGLEGIYSLIIKLSAVIFIAFLTNNLSMTLLFLLFYAGIRTFSFGIHAKTSIGCWISTITIYNIIPILIKNYHITKELGYFFIIISLISMILWAPADTPKRPLTRKKSRLKCKTYSILVIILYALIFTINSNETINKILIYALIVQSLMINPVTYKLSNTRFNNYKYYHRKTE